MYRTGSVSHSRAPQVKEAAEWRWSSYRSTVGLESPLSGLGSDGLLAMFAKRRSLAQDRYAQFVAEGITAGIKAKAPWASLKGQVFLGDDAFVQRMQAHAQLQEDDIQIPVAQRRPLPASLEGIARNAPSRDDAILAAYATGSYSYQDIVLHLGVHFTTVGRVVRHAGCNKD